MIPQIEPMTNREILQELIKEELSNAIHWSAKIDEHLRKVDKKKHKIYYSYLKEGQESTKQRIKQLKEMKRQLQASRGEVNLI